MWICLLENRERHCNHSQLAQTRPQVAFCNLVRSRVGHGENSWRYLPDLVLCESLLLSTVKTFNTMGYILNRLHHEGFIDCKGADKNAKEFPQGQECRDKLFQGCSLSCGEMRQDRGLWCNPRVALGTIRMAESGLTLLGVAASRTPLYGLATYLRWPHRDRRQLDRISRYLEARDDLVDGVAAASCLDSPQTECNMPWPIACGST